MCQTLEEKLLEIFIDMFIFLENLEDAGDEDREIEFMEGVAHKMQKCDMKQRQSFVNKIKKFANSYPEPQRKFILSLPEALGLD